MVLRERVARYLAVIVGGRHDVLQRDGVNPYGGLCEHHFGGHIRITVRNPLVVLGNLRLDVVKCGVHRLCLLALAFCAVALGIPKRPLDGLLAAELCDSPVDCHSSHNGHNSIFLLTCVHVEHGLECLSHTRYFYLVQN